VGVIVGGVALALVLVGLAVFCFLKRRRTQQPASAELKQPAQSESQYAAINVKPDEYDQSWLKAGDNQPQPAPSNYDVVPANSSDYDSGRMNVDSEL
jgi:uncharacterized iron-regulated membrane protein